MERHPRDSQASALLVMPTDGGLISPPSLPLARSEVSAAPGDCTSRSSLPFSNRENGSTGKAGVTGCLRRRGKRARVGGAFGYFFFLSTIAIKDGSRSSGGSPRRPSLWSRLGSVGKLSSAGATLLSGLAGGVCSYVLSLDGNQAGLWIGIDAPP